MKKPPPDVLRGLGILIPAISIIVDTPTCSELQECSDQQIKDAGKALQWIADIVNECERKSKVAEEKPCSP